MEIKSSYVCCKKMWSICKYLWRAQAMGNLAYIQKVNKIVGPGSDITAEAKRLVFGSVGIDSIAGPSEILVLADKKTDINEIGTSLVGQSEHGTESQCILVTKNKEIIKLKKFLKIYKV